MQQIGKEPELSRLNFGKLNNKHATMEDTPLDDALTDTENDDGQQNQLVTPEKKQSESYLSAKMCDSTTAFSSCKPSHEGMSLRSPPENKRIEMSVTQSAKTTAEKAKQPEMLRTPIASKRGAKFNTETKAMSNMTKKEEALLSRKVNPMTAMKRFKAASGNNTNMVNSLGASITFVNKTVEKEERPSSPAKSGNGQSNFTFCSNPSSANADPSVELNKKKRGRPVGSFTSSRR